jgi:hypothetical protein
MPIYHLVPIDPTDIAWGVKAVSLYIEAPSEDAARERAVALTLSRLRSRRRGRIPAHLPWLYATASFCVAAPSRATRAS